MNKQRPKISGFTFIETIMVVAILSFLIAATYGAFLSGQSIWLKTNTAIEIDEELTKAINRISSELRQSGHDANGVIQLWINPEAGPGQSDIVRFSIPVICETGGNPVDANGETAHWGAPLTWGCGKADCMDENNNCDTVEYKHIQYALDDKNRLLRQVLDFGLNPVREDMIAENITDFQIEPNFDQRMVTILLTARKNPGRHQTIEQKIETRVRLRNAR